MSLIIRWEQRVAPQLRFAELLSGFRPTLLVGRPHMSGRSSSLLQRRRWKGDGCTPGGHLNCGLVTMYFALSPQYRSSTINHGLPLSDAMDLDM